MNGKVKKYSYDERIIKFKYAQVSAPFMLFKNRKNQMFYMRKLKNI